MKTQWNFKADVRETCKLVVRPRMMALFPLMLVLAINLGIYSSVFAKMMTETMSNRTDWTSDEKTAKALLCMIALGIGEVLGSPV